MPSKGTLIVSLPEIVVDPSGGAELETGGLAVGVPDETGFAAPGGVAGEGVGFGAG